MRVSNIPNLGLERFKKLEVKKKKKKKEREIHRWFGQEVKHNTYRVFTFVKTLLLILKGLIH
jgi:hypothetical protein